LGGKTVPAPKTGKGEENGDSLCGRDLIVKRKGGKEKMF